MTTDALYHAAIMPREAVKAARLNLRDNYRLSGDVPAELELLNAVGVIALYDDTFGTGAYLEHLRSIGNLRSTR